MVTRLYVNGQLVEAATKEEMDISVLASFEDDQVQANVSVQSLTFILQAYQLLKAHIADGRIFEPLPFRIEVDDLAGNLVAFDGEIPIYKSHTINDTLYQIEASFEKKDGLNSLSEALQSLDWQFLIQKGVIGNGDYRTVEFQVIKQNNVLENLLLVITLLATVQVFIENIYKIQAAIATFVGILTGSITGSIGAAIFAGIQAAALIAYQVLITIQIVQTVSTLIQNITPLTRKGKGITFQTLLTKACQYLGYGFNTSIPNLGNYVYLPTVSQGDQFNDLDAFLKLPAVQKQGVPTVRDAGFVCADFFQICRQMFNGRFAIENGVVQFHPLGASYWEKNSTWQMPDVRTENYRYNTDEITAGYTISFATDFTDDFTIDDYVGTTYVAYTQSQGVQSIRGQQNIQIPLALGSRKSGLNGLEQAIKTFLSGIGAVVKALGGNFDPSKFLTSKIGLLRVSSPTFATAKVLYMEGTRIPANNRSILGAKALYDAYHFERSFVLNAQKRQRIIYENVEVPFGLSDFQKLSENSYFIDRDGRRGKVLNIEWQAKMDKATITYYIENQYTNRLTETYYEPS